MIILNSITDSISVVLTSSASVNQLMCTTSYRDITSTTYTAGRIVTNSNNTTKVSVVTPPSISTQRVVDFINIYNQDTSEVEVIVAFNDNVAEYILYKGILNPGQTLNFIEGFGWVNTTPVVQQKSFTVHGDAGANWVLTNSPLVERLVGNSTRSVFAVDLSNYSQVRLRVNKQVIGTVTSVLRAKYSTTFTATIGSYSTLGASGEVEISLAATGYVDTWWIDLANGAKINPCYIGFTESGGDGVADPALGATNILFR